MALSQNVFSILKEKQTKFHFWLKSWGFDFVWRLDLIKIPSEINNPFLTVIDHEFECYDQYQFGSGILKWWVLKSKIFGQESTHTKSVDELGFIKKCQNCTFKVNFQWQKSTEFIQKKLRLRPDILAKRLGGWSLSRLMKNFGLGLLTD